MFAPPTPEFPFTTGSCLNGSCYPAGIAGTYDVTLPIYGNTSVSIDTESMTADAYGYFKQEVMKDLPLILVGAFSVVVLGVVTANLLVPPRG